MFFGLFLAVNSSLPFKEFIKRLLRASLVFYLWLLQIVWSLLSASFYVVGLRTKFKSKTCIENVKTDPWLIFDLHSRFPPNASQIYFEIVKPNPRAAKLCIMLFSSFEYQKGEKIYFWSSSVIPMPLSKTYISIRFWSLYLKILPIMLIGSPSWWENLIAFLIKFRKTYWNLLLSKVREIS